MNNMSNPEKITSASNTDNTGNTNNVVSNKEDDGLNIFWTTNKKELNEAIVSDDEQEKPQQITEDAETKGPKEKTGEGPTLEDLRAEAEKRGLDLDTKPEAEKAREGMIDKISGWFKRIGAHLFVQGNKGADVKTAWHFGDAIHQWDEESKTFANVVKQAKQAEQVQISKESSSATKEPENAETVIQPEDNPEVPKNKDADADKDKEVFDSKPKAETAEKISEEDFKKQGTDLIKLAAEKLDRDELPEIIDYVKKIEKSDNYNPEGDYRLTAIKIAIDNKNTEYLKETIDYFLNESKRSGDK